MKSKVSFEDCVAALALCLMLSLVCGEIILRNFLNVSFLWSEELARYLMIWSVYFGAASAIRSGEHLRIEIILDHIGPKRRQALELFAQLWVLVFSLAITYAGYLLVRDSFAFGFMSADSNLSLPLGWVQLVIPITFGLSAVHALRNMYTLCSVRKTKVKQPSGAQS